MFLPLPPLTKISIMAKLHSHFLKTKRTQRFDLRCLNYDEYMMLKRLVQYAESSMRLYGYQKTPLCGFDICSLNVVVSADETQLRTLIKLSKVL